MRATVITSQEPPSLGWAVADDPSSGRPLDVEQVRLVRFRATKFRSGYDQDEVDALLDRVERTLADVHGRLSSRERITARQLADVRLEITRWREGYDRAVVDAFLQRAVDRLRELER